MLEPLGEGGAATVHRCWDRELGVERAIKLRRIVDRDRQADGMQRLEDEARIMARLTHEHVLPVFDIGQDAGWQWVVMELARGGSLRDRTAVGPLSPRHAANVVIALLGATQAAHDLGVVHRDIKPHNVLLDEEGKPMLADWGIARLDERALTLTSTGVAMGSMSYMAPEQRLDAHQVDGTADVYSMGALLYNITTCASPVDLFMAPETSPRWDEIPPVLRPILARACSKKPAHRYPTARAFADALTPVLPQLSDVPISLGPPSANDSTLHGDRDDRTLDPGEIAATPVPRWPYWVAGGVGLIAVGLVAALLVPGVVPTAQTVVVPAPPTTTVDDPDDAVSVEAPTPVPTRDATPDEPSTPVAAPSSGGPSAATVELNGDPVEEADLSTGVVPPSPIHGTWTGGIEGQRARLRLTGAPAALRGTLTVAERSSRVRGRFNPESASATLTVQGSEFADGTWTLDLDGDRLRGSISLTGDGDLLPVSFRRAPIR